MLHFDPSKKQSNHKRNDARSDNEAFTDPQRAVDKDARRVRTSGSSL